MKKHLSLILAMCMILSMAFAGTAAAFTVNNDDAVEYSEEVVKDVQRALDRVEVENVISKHEYYHSALNHMGEFLEIWVNEDPWMETMSWTNNNQKMVGAYNVWGFMVPDLVSNISNSLGSAMNNDDQGIIQESDEWYGTGMFWYHMLMSPVIVVADDGQTARACFQSFGTVTGPMGDLCAQWTCESYGFDCAKMSTGEWKIWHLHTYVYFYVDTTSTWAYTRSSSTPSGVDAALLPTGAALTNTDAPEAPEGESPEGESPAGEAPAADTPKTGADQVVNGVRLGDLDMNAYTFDELVAMGFDMTPPGDMTPPEEAPAEEATGTKSAEEAYIDYIRDFLQAELLVNPYMTQEQIDNEYIPLIEAGNYTDFPASHLFQEGWLQNGTAMSFEEFKAQYVPGAAPVEEAPVAPTEEAPAAPEGESPEGEAPADMTPPGGAGGPGGAPGGGGGYSQGDYEVIRGEFFTNYSIYKTPESCPIPYPYDTWATVEANGDSY